MLIIPAVSETLRNKLSIARTASANNISINQFYRYRLLSLTRDDKHISTELDRKKSIYLLISVSEIEFNFAMIDLEILEKAIHTCICIHVYTYTHARTHTHTYTSQPQYVKLTVRS